MTKISILSSALYVSFCFVTSCTNANNPDPGEKSKPGFDLTAAKKDIEEANRNFCGMLSKSDSVGLANSYATDAEMMVPNAPAVVGRKNIQTEISNIINSGATKLDLKTINLWGDEGMLIEEGILTLATKDGKQLDKGKYIVLWKKEDGTWKLFRDCFNSDLPAPSSK